MSHCACWHRAGADCKLGFQRRPPHLVPLPDLAPDGGVLPATLLVIQRVFPVLYLSTDEGGVRTPRTARAQERAEHAMAAQAAQVCILSALCVRLECTSHSVSELK